MKIKDVNHNHSLTDLLKVSIFSLLMLAPMINVGVRSAYVICNKNAYQSYYGETINESRIVPVYDKSTIINDYVYYRNAITTDSGTTATYNIYYTSIEIIQNTDTNITDEDILSSNNITVEAYNTNTLTILKNDSTSIQNLNSSNGQLVLKLFVTNITGTIPERTQNLYVYEYNKYSYLDNVFEYSVNQLTENTLYNWVENTAIYDGVTLMNTQLGITQPVISLLIVYWLLLTIIYIIIDIILKVFTWLTHMIGSKTA